MRPAKLESRWAVVGGLRLHARVSPGAETSTAPSAILLHSLGVSSLYLVPTGRLLAAGCRVFAPDLPGFGLSDKPRQTLDVPALADVLVGWMDAMGLPSAALLANSMGCQVAADCACRHPGRLTRLVLLGPTVDPAARTALEQTARLVLAARWEPPNAWMMALREYWTCGPARVMETLRHVLRDRPEDKFPSVTVPSLVVRGENDPICPQRWAERVARLLPNGRLAVIPRAGHIPNYSMPAELARVALPFLLGPEALVNR